MNVSEKKPISPDAALARLQALCARSEQCSYEIRLKLRKWGVEQQTAQKILNQLKEQRFVDDVRYAHAYVRDKTMFARWGEKKIRMGLAAKRIDREIIAEAMSEHSEDIVKTNLETLLRSKARNMHDADSYESRTKLLRFAAGRGYPVSLAMKVLDEIFAEN